MSSTWTLYGTLTDASGTPQRGVAVSVAPPGVPFTTPSGGVIVAPTQTVSGANGGFGLAIESIPNTVWRVRVDDEDEVYLPDPGIGTFVNINTLSPAYVPSWQGGKQVKQGAGVVSVRSEGSSLVFGLSNGLELDPVSYLSSQALDTDRSQRALLPFRRAVNSGAVRVVAMGGSIAQGKGLSNVASRWQDVLRNSLRASLFPISNPANDAGYGYVPAILNGSLLPGIAPTTQGAVAQLTSRGGLGMNAFALGPDFGGQTSYATWQSNDCSTIRLYYGLDNVRNGSFDILIDGAVVDTLSSNAVAPRAGNVWTWTGPRGAHTIRVRWTNVINAPALIEGVHFSTASGGVSFWDCTLANATTETLARGTAGAPGAQAKMYESLQSVDPHLVVLEAGLEDMGSMTPDRWAENLQLIVDKVRLHAPRTGIVILHAPSRLSDARGSSATDYPEKLTEFEDAAIRSVGTDPAVTILFESRWWHPINATGISGQDPWGWMSDETTPSATAHRTVGEQTNAFLLSGTASSVASLSPAEADAIYQTKATLNSAVNAHLGGDAANLVARVVAAEGSTSGNAKTANNLSDLTDPTTARNNLGLGTAATQQVVSAGQSGVLSASDPTTTNARNPLGHASSHGPDGNDTLQSIDGDKTQIRLRRIQGADTSVANAILPLGEAVVSRQWPFGLYVGDGVNSIGWQNFFRNYYLRYDQFPAQAAEPPLAGTQAIGASAYTTLKTAGGTVPGLTKTLALRQPGTVQVTISLDVTMTGPDTVIATASCAGQVSTTQAVWTNAATGTSRNSLSKTWVFTGVPSGSQVVSVQCWSTGSATVTVGAPHSQMSYLYNPGGVAS